jgi:hypothetical protein
VRRRGAQRHDKDEQQKRSSSRSSSSRRDHLHLSKRGSRNTMDYTVSDGLLYVWD